MCPAEARHVERWRFPGFALFEENFAIYEGDGVYLTFVVEDGDVVFVSQDFRGEVLCDLEHVEGPIFGPAAVAVSGQEVEGVVGC